MGQSGTATPLLAGVPWNRTVAFAVTFAAVWGSLSGTPSAGIRRSPGRASAPTARPFPGWHAVGSAVRPDVHTSPSVPPSVGTGQLTVVAQCPDRRATTVHQPVGAP